MNLRDKHWAIIFIGILVVVLVFIMGWYLFGSEKVIAPSQQMATTTPQTATTTTALPASAPAHIVQHAKYYDIDMAYPSVTPLVSVSAAANAAAVKEMRDALQQTVTEFERDQDLGNASPEDIKIMGLDKRKEALGAQYKTYTGARTVSYVFEIYSDTLGAHPNIYYRTFTFDTKSGASLKLSSIFVTGSNYLGAVSSIAAAKLPQILADREQVSVSEIDTDYMRSGISPEPDSFQSWYISGSKFTVVFPPYQVGPYALGTIELPIPLSSLTSLKAEYK